MTRVISTEQDLKEYREERHATILKDNPGRDFAVLFNWPNGRIEELILPLDDKGILS